MASGLPLEPHTLSSVNGLARVCPYPDKICIDLCKPMSPGENGAFCSPSARCANAYQSGKPDRSAFRAGRLPPPPRPPGKLHATVGQSSLEKFAQSFFQSQFGRSQ